MHAGCVRSRGADSLTRFHVQSVLMSSLKLKLAKLSVWIPGVDLVLYGISAVLSLTIGEIGQTRLIEIYGIITFMALPLCFLIGIMLSIVSMFLKADESGAGKKLGIASLILNVLLLLAYLSFMIYMSLLIMQLG